MDEPLSRETRQRVIDLSSEHIPLAATLLDNAVTIRNRLHDLGLRSEDQILNAYELTLPVEFDLSCLICGLFEHDRTARAGFYARQIVLTLLESARTLRGMLGRTFREGMRERLGESADDSLKAAHSRIGSVFDSVEAAFGEVRDKVVAHYDADPEARASSLRRVSPEEVARLVLELTPALQSLTTMFHDYLVDLLSRAKDLGDN